MKNYFSYDYDNGFLLHESDALAREHIEYVLECDRGDVSYDGWCEDIEECCIGVITHKVKEHKEGEYYDFKLVATKENQ